MKARFHLIFLGIFGLFSAPFVVPVFRDWSRINCRDQQVDVFTGLARDTRYIYWIPFNRTINKTALSEALSDDSPATRAHRWELVNTFGPYSRHSPHYAYHSALHQISHLQMVWEEFEFDPVERRKSAKGLLREWQTSGSDWSANEYLREQMKLAEQSHDQ